jgi:hypothetical protein
MESMSTVVTASEIAEVARVIPTQLVKVTIDDRGDLTIEPYLDHAATTIHKAL